MSVSNPDKQQVCPPCKRSKRREEWGVNLKQDEGKAIEEGEIVRGCVQGYNGVGRRNKPMIRVGKNGEECQRGRRLKRARSRNRGSSGSRSYKRGENGGVSSYNKEDVDICSCLSEQLDLGLTECMVCMERVQQMQPTLDCRNCF